jgi:hypothetical protein
MPKGWSTESGTANTQNAAYPAGEGYAQCLGEPTGFPAAVPPEVDSPYFQNRDGSLEVQDSITVFNTAAQATSSFSTLASPKVAGCATTLLNSYLSSNPPKGAKIGTVTVSPPLGSRFGLDTNGYVVAAPITANGVTGMMTTTYVFFVRGQLGQQLMFTVYSNAGSSSSFPASTIRHLTTVAQERYKPFSAPPNTTSSNSSSQSGAVVACENDFKSLAVAVEAYSASPNNGTGAFPQPPAQWSAATYKNNFQPLLADENGGPYMHEALDPTNYVIEYDGKGNVWVEPAGQYDTTYNPAHGSDKDCALVLR